MGDPTSGPSAMGSKPTGWSEPPAAFVEEIDEEGTQPDQSERGLAELPTSSSIYLEPHRAANEAIVDSGKAKDANG